MVIALRSAAVAIEGNRPELALESLESAIDFEPALGALHLPAAEIALAAGAPEKALVHLEAAARLHLPDTIQICLRNRAHLALGNISEAVENLELLIETCSTRAQFLLDLVQSYLNEDNPIMAQSLLEQLSSIVPSDPYILLSLAVVTATIKPEEALPYLRQANSLTSGSSPLSIELIKTIEAARYFNQPSYSLAQVGQTLARLGEWTPAVWAFRHALELDPEYVEARTYLGLALDRVGVDGLVVINSPGF